MGLLSTQIANMALSHINVSKPIANLDTENSQEARACRVFYDTARQATLRDFNWPFARKIVTLALVETTPNCQWAFSYQYPSDCLGFRKILSPLSRDTRQSRIPYKEYLSADGTSTVIYTNKELAQGEYTVDVSNSNLFKADFTLAFSLRLASYIAPVVTGGDPFKMGQRALQLYVAEITNAQANAANEEQEPQEPQSEFIRERDGYGPWIGSREGFPI